MKENERKFIKFGIIALIIFSIFSIIETMVSLHGMFKITNNITTYDSIIINLVLKKNVPTDKVLACYNGYCKSAIAESFNKVYTLRYNEDDENFYKNKKANVIIGYNDSYKDIKDNLELIDMHVGSSDYYFNDNDIKNLKEKSFKINLDESDKQETIKAIELPEVNYYRGILNDIVISFLSLFYNWEFFIIPYFWLFVATVLFIYNKDLFNIKLDFKNININYLILALIIIVGIIVRINGIGYFQQYGDEEYTRSIAIKSLLSCFQDPGNPPLFFIIEYVFSKIFSDSIISLRIMPLIFGIAFIPATYLLFKNYSKNLALFGAFMAMINTINIVQSQEARGYSLDMLLIVLGIYFFIKYIKNPNTKNLTINGILNAILINTHYFLILFVITNYIWAVFSFIKQKNLKEIFKYTIINILAALTFIPFLIISSQRALEKDFNSWIPQLGEKVFNSLTNVYFVNKYILIGIAIIILANIFIHHLPKLSDKIKSVILNISYIALIVSSSGLGLIIIDEALKTNFKISFLQLAPVISGNLTVIFAICIILALLIVSSIKTDKDNYNNDLKNLLVYLCYSFIAIFVFACTISLLIKPIIHAKILLSIYAILLLVETIIIVSVFKANKEDKIAICAKILYSILLFFAVTTLAKPINKYSLTFSPLMHFIQQDSIRYAKDYQIHVILPDYTEYKDSYPVKELDYITWHKVDGNKGEHYRDIKDEDLGIPHKKTIVYLSTVGLLGTFGVENIPKYMGKQNAYIYKTSAVPIVKMIYE